MHRLPADANNAEKRVVFDRARRSDAAALMRGDKLDQV